MTAPRYRWPGVKGVSLQHKQENRDFDPAADFNRYSVWAMAIAAPFVTLVLVAIR